MDETSVRCASNRFQACGSGRPTVSVDYQEIYSARTAYGVEQVVAVTPSRECISDNQQPFVPTY